MKQLKNNIYKNIASILASDKPHFKTATNLILFARTISAYPSKSLYYQIINRLISFHERNISSIPLIIDTMKNEGEDEELITTITFLHENPTIKTQSEVFQLCRNLADYVKYEKILKVKNSFISTLDLVDEEVDDNNIKGTVDTLYNLANQIIAGYNIANVSGKNDTFDTNNKDGMKNVVAHAVDNKKADKIMRTSVRMLNTLLSPGYMSPCIYTYVGLPGQYKSGILLTGHVDCCEYNQHIKTSLNGKTPISMYVSMENSMGQTINRLWAILFPNASMSMFTVDEATDMINDKLTSQGFRSVILYYGYREKSAADIAQIIRSYNDDEHEVVIVFLDYIKRMRPARTDVAATSSEKAELNAIMNEIKTLICVEFNIPCVTGHQLNRTAAIAVDNMIASGGFNKTDEVLGRSQVSVA